MKQPRAETLSETLAETLVETHADERERLGAAVDADTRLYFILGDPIHHARAPVVWSALFRCHGINAVFLPAQVAPADIDAAIAGLKALRNLDGLMFTMPHKAAALRHADALTERARRAGALNLMRREPDGTWSGDNVDGAGFVAGLTAEGLALEGRRVYLHGAGGVGANIAFALAAEPIAGLTIFDLDMRRAESLAQAVARETGVSAHAAAFEPAATQLAINASPLGWNPADPLPFAVDALPAGAVVADVLMEPLLTPLLAAAAARGLATHHGRHMMNHAMPLAAAFYGLPLDVEWNGAGLQG